MIIKRNQAQFLDPRKPEPSPSGTALGHRGHAHGTRHEFGIEDVMGDADLSSLDEGGDDLWDGDELGHELLEGTSRERRQRQEYGRYEEKNIITKAHEEANAIRENAYREGYEEGMQQAQGVIRELQDAMERLYKAREEALLSVAEEVTPLAIEMAQSIIKTEVSCDDALIITLLKDTIQRTDRRTKQVLLKVNPVDRDVVLSATQSASFMPDRNTEYVVLEEETVDPGSCILETATGMIDARFSTQIQMIQRVLGLAPPI